MNLCGPYQDPSGPYQDSNGPYRDSNGFYKDPGRWNPSESYWILWIHGPIVTMVLTTAPWPNNGQHSHVICDYRMGGLISSVSDLMIVRMTRPR